MTGILWSHAIVGVIGAFLGAVVRIGYFRLLGRKVYVPFIERSAFAFTGLVVLMSALSLITIVQQQHNTNESEDCNRQFRAALAYNAQITDEQRGLTTRAQDISVVRRMALDGAIAKLGEDLTDPASVKAVIDNYNVRAAELADQYDALTKERRDADDKRKPYPAPACGSK